MANIVFNIAKGRGVELYRLIKSGDFAQAAFIVIPIETAGLETDAVLKDKRTLSAVLSGTTNEQTTMGRKVLVAADLAAMPTPDDTGDFFEVALPAITWAAPAGNAISKMLVCFRKLTADADTAIEPLSMFDRVYTPNGIDLVLTAGAFLRSQEPV